MCRRVLLVAGCLTLLLGAALWLRECQVNQWRVAGGSAGQAQSSSRKPQHSLGQFNTENLAVPREQILSGGPGKDGIPALTTPKLLSVKDAAFLRDTDRVVMVDIGGDTRAYPLSILNWHEVVNDVVSEVPIAVVYCPLCDSATVVDRRIAGKTLEFGVSGLLLNSNVLFYDRTDNALWSQAGLVAISGPQAGRSLKHLPWRITTAAVLRQEHPDARVLDVDTGHRRDYSRNPYASYFMNDQLMFPVAREDKRLSTKARVVGVKRGDASRAYPVDLIVSQPGRTLSDTWGEKRLVLTADGQGGVSVVEMPDDALVVYTFWFAWAAFHPGTDLYAPSSARPPQGGDHVAPNRF